MRRACFRYDSPLEPRWELKFSACLPPFILLRPRFLSAPQVSINQHGKQQGGATMCLPRMIGPALDDHVSRSQSSFATFEDERCFSLQETGCRLNASHASLGVASDR